MLTAQIGALFTAALGVGGMLFPAKVIRLINLDFRPDRVEAKTEVRATLGGLFLCAGLFSFLVNSPEAYGTLGAAWIGAGLIRTLFMGPDHSVTRINIVSILIEFLVGFLLIMPWVSQAL
ncbi:MAG: hypothetical protein COA47_02560 [Robiginitomaculum sp.]|nr:MAG: hypothetical protein COA47_02560 [Robiginitomaculum sp.]